MNNAAAFLVEELVGISVLVSQCKSGSNDSECGSGFISTLFALAPTLGAEESATGPDLRPLLHHHYFGSRDPASLGAFDLHVS